jgi:hypothetical protein
MRIRRYKEKWQIIETDDEELKFPWFNTQEAAKRHIELVSILRSVEKIQQLTNQLHSSVKNLKNLR